MSNPFAHKSNDEINAMWQMRALRASTGKLQQVLFRALANEYTAVTHNTWQVLLRMIDPKFVDVQLPALIGYARIMPSGRVVSEVIDKDYCQRLQMIYRNQDEFISEMRKLADRLKLSDDDRSEMFAVLCKWITADYRVGVEGQRLAS